MSSALTRLEALTSSLHHELIHWAVDFAPQAYRDRIKNLMRVRTSGFSEPIVPLQQIHGVPYAPAVLGMRDGWADFKGDEYPGRVYAWETHSPNGAEIPSVFLEKLELHPSSLLDYINHYSHKSKSFAWREAFLESLSLFF